MQDVSLFSLQEIIVRFLKVSAALQAAIAEAGFMTGMERNSDIVKLASYAPLFIHQENHGWATNLINIDNHRCAKSYLHPRELLFYHGFCSCIII